MIQCAMTRLYEISNHQIPVSGESLLTNLLDSFVHSDSDSESFHGFTDSEIRSALRSLRGCAVLEDAETDAIEAGAEEVNVTDEKSGTLEFVSPDNDLVTVKGCLVKAGYECQDASIAYFPNVEDTPNGIEKKMLLEDGASQDMCTINIERSLPHQSQTNCVRNVITDLLESPITMRILGNVRSS